MPAISRDEPPGVVEDGIFLSCLLYHEMNPFLKFISYEENDPKKNHSGVKLVVLVHLVIPIVIPFMYNSNRFDHDIVYLTLLLYALTLSTFYILFCNYTSRDGFKLQNGSLNWQNIG